MSSTHLEPRRIPCSSDGFEVLTGINRSVSFTASTGDITEAILPSKYFSTHHHHYAILNIYMNPLSYTFHELYFSSLQYWIPNYDMIWIDAELKVIILKLEPRSVSSPTAIHCSDSYTFYSALSYLANVLYQGWVLRRRRYRNFPTYFPLAGLSSYIMLH